MSFPPNPTDGMLIQSNDSWYQYSAREKSWIRLDGLPQPELATPQRDGLMPKEDFIKVDGLILPPLKTSLRISGSDLVIDRGIINFRSEDESLNITPSPQIMNAGVEPEELPWKLHENTVGIDFTLNIDQLIQRLEQKGKIRYLKRKGPQGLKGRPGKPGIDRLDTGPQGPQGDPGANAPFDGTLSIEEISFAPNTVRSNRAIVDVKTEEVSPSENYLVVTRANLGNPNACPSLVRPKNFESPWLLATDGLTSCYPTTTPGCAPCPTLYYLDIDPILQSIQERYEQLAYELKAVKEELVNNWLKTMMEIFNEQKNALCCALENCQSRKRNQDKRDLLDNARIQAAQADKKLVVSGPTDQPHVEMDPGKTCSLPDGRLDVITYDVCPVVLKGQSNIFTASPNGNGDPMPLNTIPGMDLEHGGYWTDPYQGQTYAQYVADFPAGQYTARWAYCCPVTVGRPYISKNVQIVYNSGQSFVVVGQNKDYTWAVDQLMAQGYALDFILGSPESPLWDITQADMAKLPPVKFTHAGGWMATFINHNEPLTEHGPNVNFVNGQSAVLLQRTECLCKPLTFELEAAHHAAAEFNENVGVRIKNLPPGVYVVEITDCCYDKQGKAPALYSGAYETEQKQLDGTWKNIGLSVAGEIADAFYKEEDAKAAYENLRQTIVHDGNELHFWIKDQDGSSGNKGSITLSLTDVSCFEDAGGGSTGGTEGDVPTSCEMVATQIEWYERGWRIEKCCGAYVEYGGVKWLVIKRSIGIDMTCGGGENAETPCLKTFISAGVGHPAIAWPSLDGVEFEAKPKTGSKTFIYDPETSQAIIDKIKAGDVIAKIGAPEGIELVLFPSV